MARPVYLHLLDRELGDAVRQRLSAEQIEMAVQVLTLATAVPLYSGLSLAWEHPSIDASLQSLLALLIQQQQLDLVSNHPVLDEFLATRGSMYEHDRERYGQYFAGGQRPFEPTRYKPVGTTMNLHAQLENELGSSAPTVVPDAAKPVVERVLERREGRAITYALFEAEMADIALPIVGGLRRAISNLYTSHYLEFDSAVIPTGVPGLGYFDTVLAEEYPTVDVQVLGAVLRLVGFSPELDARASDNPGFWEAATIRRMTVTDLADRTRELVLLAHVAEGRPSAPSRTATARLIGRLTRWIRSVDTPRPAPSDRFTAAALLLTSAIGRMLERRPELRCVLRDEGRVGTLVVVATEVEEDMLREVLERRYRRQPGVLILRRTVCREMGVFRRGRASYVRCRIGGHSLGGAGDVVRDAIDELEPREVVMIGIAFGMDDQRQPIGTVLVSTRVIDYRSERIGTSATGSLEVKPRAEPGDASLFLVRAFSALGERRPERTEAGPLLSDHVLVDNLEFRNALADRFPEAIGGEMEGYGVYTASYGRYRPWILVKAVCDWGDGQKAVDKANRQRVAATVAAERLFDYLDE